MSHVGSACCLTFKTYRVSSTQAGSFRKRVVDVPAGWLTGISMSMLKIAY